MNYEEALSYVDSTAARGSKLGLERVRELTARLGSPQNAMQIIHIAGTNGKGSVGAMLASILTQAGYRTGHFASPALTSPLDYYRIQTAEVTEQQFTAAICAVREQAEAMEDLPTQFEILATAAYVLFAQEHCDIAVIECCMGGDLDCTNVIDKPLLSILTNVQLDHMSFLGDTVEEIARHKAGILKPGCPVLLGCSLTDPAAREVIRERAASLASPLYESRQGSGVSMTLDGTILRFGEQTYKLPLLGTYQLANAATVLSAVQILREQECTLPEQAVRAGLEQVYWHGRFEVLHRDPLVIYDGAHNPDGIRNARETFDIYFGTSKAIFVIGVMADKAYAGYADMLKPCMEAVFTVQPDHPRALDAPSLANVFTEAGIPCQAASSVQTGVQEAVSCAKKYGLPVIGIGSLYLYREFCEALKRIL